MAMNITRFQATILARATQANAQMRSQFPDLPLPEFKPETTAAYLHMEANFYTQCASLRADLFRRVAYLAHPCKDPVVILGESGTGKEIVAQALGSGAKFVAINVTSLPDYLIESELFGHKQGAFTGAISDKVGLLEEASGGTVFLDEIGDMPLTMQAKLLRAIQTMSIRRVGSNEPRPINCRFVSATHRQLDKLCSKWEETGGLSGFRPDLYWRLCTHEILIPPLRERDNDISYLFNRLGYSGPTSLCSSGNYRELETIVARWKLQNKLSA